VPYKGNIGKMMLWSLEASRFQEDILTKGGRHHIMASGPLMKSTPECCSSYKLLMAFFPHFLNYFVPE
jgi:hypothetical protein